MKILLHSLNYFPELIGIGKYNREMAEWLADRGHEVRVVCAPPYYPAWRVGEPYSARAYRRERIGGVQVWRCPLHVKQNPSGLTRILHYLSFAASSFPVMAWLGATWRPDVIISIEPTILCAATAHLVSAAFGSATLLHVQDFEIDAAFEIGALGQGVLGRLVRLYERAVTRRFDAVTSISGKMVEKARSLAPACRHVHLFPNWADLEAIHPLDEADALAVDGIDGLAGLAGETVVLYAGNLGEKQGIDMLVDGARAIWQAGRRDIRFIICGDGARRQALAEMAQGLPNVRLIPLQDRDRYNLLLNRADIHVLPQKAGFQDLVKPSKLGSILAAGGAVLAQTHGGSEVHDVVSASGGMVIPPGDLARLVEAIRDLADDPARRRAMRVAARRYATEHLGKEAILKSFETFLGTLLDRHGRARPGPASGETRCA
jgi:colanic acid biosynthesis glycosyl transferase WcaI